MGAINPAIYQEMEISAETTTGVPKTIDLKLGVVKFNYYEDLFSPCLTAQLLIVSAGGATQTDVKEGESGETIENVYSGLPIRGGERVKIKIKPNTEKNAALEFDTPEKYFYVSNVSKQFSDGSKEIFTLDLVSREAITNETSRVVKRYPKESKISDHVKTIIEDRLASTIKDEDIDETVNKYGFIGNLKKPFHVLVWLASKSKPKKGLPGYFFYQTKDGFKFKSIDSLIEDGNKSEKITYRETNYKPSSVLSDVADFTILQYNVVQNNDLLTKLALGQFSSHIMEFDPLLGTFTTQEQGKFTLDDITEESINLGETPEVPKLLNDDTTQNLGTLPSRLITMVTDRGVLDFEPVTDKNSDPKLWQRQAYMRYQLLFTQVLNMVVPLNTNLSVGNIIFVEFLQSSMEAKERDRQQSGSYMIKELCHHFDPNQSLTSMTLIRDTFGEISQ
tara:strand:+ start:858 stop:2201 length:1344 start_codon:yes stop_codon:yes gene_type:complete